MEDTRVFDEVNRSWSCDVCKSDVFNNSCGCIQYTKFWLEQSLENLELQELGYKVFTNPRILELLKDEAELKMTLWALKRRQRTFWTAYEEWQPFEDQYYEDDWEL
jgi:hypothetical protein